MIQKFAKIHLICSNHKAFDIIVWLFIKLATLYLFLFFLYERAVYGFQHFLLNASTSEDVGLTHWYPGSY